MSIFVPQKLLHRFRMIGIAEGISFLVLLPIAMPLKYFFKNTRSSKKLLGGCMVSFL